MSRQDQEAEGLLFTDTAEHAWLPIGVAIDAYNTEYPENFIHIIDASTGQFAVSSLDPSIFATEEHHDFILEMLAQHPDGRGAFVTTEEERESVAFHREETQIRQVHALHFDFEPRAGGIVVNAATRRTVVDLQTPGQMSNYTIPGFTIAHDEHLRDEALELEKIAGMIDKPPYLVRDVVRGENVPIDLSEHFSHVNGPNFYRHVLGGRQDMNTFELYNAQMMALANRCHAQFMLVNGIPGGSLTFSTDHDNPRYVSLDEIEGDRVVIGAMTSPLFSAMDIINVLNTRAFLSNPKQPEYPFSSADIKAALAVFRTSDTVRPGSSQLVTSLADLLTPDILAALDMDAPDVA